MSDFLFHYIGYILIILGLWICIKTRFIVKRLFMSLGLFLFILLDPRLLNPLGRGSVIFIVLFLSAMFFIAFFFSKGTYDIFNTTTLEVKEPIEAFFLENNTLYETSKKKIVLLEYPGKDITIKNQLGIIELDLSGLQDKDLEKRILERIKEDLALLRTRNISWGGLFFIGLGVLHQVLVMSFLK